MNYLMVAAPRDRHRPIPLAVLGSTQEGREEISAELGPTTYFDTPKPQRLLRHLVRELTQPDSMVLDPYAGSGSLGVAVTAQNRADGGTRSCVLIERSDAAVTVLLARAEVLATRL